MADLRRNPFEILGVTVEADLATIRTAYRSLAKVYHPDILGGDATADAARLMADINWAWAQLQNDLEAWRGRFVGPRVGDITGSDEYYPEGTEERERWWRNFTEQYRVEVDPLRGWRGWVGEGVVCTNCGCTLSTWVYKCPDCGRVDSWQRSSLHRVGHRFARPFSALVYIAAVVPASLFFLGLLMIPPLLVWELIGESDSGLPWEWNLGQQIFVGVGTVVEVLLIIWRNWSSGKSS